MSVKAFCAVNIRPKKKNLSEVQWAYQENIAGGLDLINIVRLCKLEVSFRV